jgi:hypothetical protein
MVLWVLVSWCFSGFISLRNELKIYEKEVFETLCSINTGIYPKNSALKFTRYNFLVALVKAVYSHRPYSVLIISSVI